MESRFDLCRISRLSFQCPGQLAATMREAWWCGEWHRTDLNPLAGRSWSESKSGTGCIQLVRDGIRAGSENTDTEETRQADTAWYLVLSFRYRVSVEMRLCSCLRVELRTFVVNTGFYSLHRVGSDTPCTNCEIRTTCRERRSVTNLSFKCTLIRLIDISLSVLRVYREQPSSKHEVKEIYTRTPKRQDNKPTAPTETPCHSQQLTL